MEQLELPQVTGSAFTQARYKIDPSFFKALNQKVVDNYHGANKKKWKGHLLLAGDGSTINLPHSREIKNHFGVNHKTQYGVGRSMARTLFLYDVMNQVIVSNQLSTMSYGEKPLLFQSLGNLPQENHLILLDKGYGHHSTMKELETKGFKFCIKLPLRISLFAKRALKEPQNDFITEWVPSPSERECLKKNQLDSNPLTVRVTKIKLKNGDVELLITNLLDIKKYKHSDIKKLYQMRWGVEEAFKKLKPKMKLEQFGCKKPKGVFQEYYAHLFMMNLIAMIKNVAECKVGKSIEQRRYHYSINWKNTYRVVRRNIIQLFVKKKCEDFIQKLINQIQKFRVANIPNRSFPRARDKKIIISHYYK